MPQGHYGEYSGNHPRFSKKDDHAYTRVTDHNLDSTKKDDEAHMDYLKQDIKWDDKHGHSDENMTADEKHITYLAEDEKYDEKHHSPAKQGGFAQGVGVASKRSELNIDAITGGENPTVHYVAPQTLNMADHVRGGSNETVQAKSNSDGGSENTGGDGGYNINIANANAPSAQNPQGHGKTDFMKNRIDHLEKTGSNPAKLARLEGRLERTEIRQANRADRISDRNVKKKQRVQDWQKMRNA